MTDIEAKPKRIIGFDVARAFAILGMVIVNFNIVMNPDGGSELLKTIAGLFEGRAVALFIVLAGIGITLLTRRAIASADSEKIAEKRRNLLKRALFLFVVGLLYSPIWPADILHFYGVYLLIGTMLLLASDRQLLLAAVGAIGMFIVLLVVFDYEAGWNFDTLDYVDFWTPVGMLRHLFFNGFHPVFPWVAFLLIGMWLGRQDLNNQQLRQKLLIGAATIALITEALSTFLINQFSTDSDLALFFDTAPLPPMPLYIIAGAATAIVIIILCLMLTENTAQRLWFPLVATGQLALTLYVAHVIIGMGTLEEIGWFEGANIEQVFIATLTFYMASIIFATLWRSRYQRGPLEAVMRRLTD